MTWQIEVVGTPSGIFGKAWRLQDRNEQKRQWETLALGAAKPFAKKPSRRERLLLPRLPEVLNCLWVEDARPFTETISSVA